MVDFLAAEWIYYVDLAVENYVETISFFITVVAVGVQDFLHHCVEIDAAGLSEDGELDFGPLAEVIVRVRVLLEVVIVLMLVVQRL